MNNNDITNNDDCNINIINTVDVALEMTKLYLTHHSSSHWIDEDTIFATYKDFKDKLDKIDEEDEEDED